MRAPFLTNRLILRDITEADAQLLLELDADPEVMRHIGPPPPASVEGYRDRIQSVYIPWQAHPWQGIWIVADRRDEAFLGWVFIRPAMQSTIASELDWTAPGAQEIGFRFRRAAWGRGIATESAQAFIAIALADRQTTAVVACAHAGNRGSLRVLEKLGLTRQGEVRLSGASEPTVKLIRYPARPASADGSSPSEA